MELIQARFTEVVTMDYQTLTFSIIFVLISCILLHKATTSSSHNHCPCYPPGPRPLPVIGNMHQLGRWPHRTLHRLAGVYGPIMRLKLGAISTTVISSPHHTKLVLQKYDSLFSSRLQGDTIKAKNHHEHSVIFLPVCPKWRNLRKALATELLSQARLDASQSIRNLKVQQLTDHIGNNLLGKVVNIRNLVFTMMINSLSSTLLSVDLGCYESGVSSEFFDLSVKALKVAGTPNLSDFIPALAFLDLQGLRRRNEFYGNRILEIIGSVVESRKGSRFGTSSEIHTPDVLDALLDHPDYDLSCDDIKHLFADLLAGGTEASSNTMEWAMAELMHNPSKMARVQSEVRGAVGNNGLRPQESNIVDLPYLQAVVKETLRLHPPAPFLIPHQAVADVEIDGFMVPKDSQVVINMWSMGRDPRTWSDPDLFEPERFLELETEYKDKNFAYLPFGAGRRSCPGLPLAHRSIVMVVASLVYCFDWELEKGMKPEEMDMSDSSLGFMVHKAVSLRAIPTLKKVGTMKYHL